MPDLILEIRVPGYYVEDWPAALASDDYDDLTVIELVEEHMRNEVTVSLIGHPGDGETSEEFTLHAMDGLIVGARIDDPANTNTSETGK